MRVLVAGATGVLGRQVLPVLAGAGHEVVGLARRVDDGSGYSMIQGDLLDPQSLRAAVRSVRPDAVVHLATAIPQRFDMRRFGEAFAMTNRLRTEGTRNLVEAADGARLISQGLAYAYRPAPGLADEETPLWTDNATEFGPVARALQELEERTVKADGLVLRFGHLYGPGTAFDRDGAFLEMIRGRKLPVVGSGEGMFSFTHTRDAAMAVLAALDKPVTGALHIVDDDPAPLRVWLPALAAQLGARRPMRVPAWIARMLVGPWGVTFMTGLRGADNARARLALDWRPGYRSWRDGFAAELGGRA
jgi:nucleoside-diphosphate-sugar epimerase